MIRPIFKKRVIRKGPTIFGNNKERKGGIVKTILIGFFYSALRKVITGVGTLLIGALLAAQYITPEMYEQAMEGIKQMGRGEWLLGLGAVGLVLGAALWTFIKKLIQEWRAKRKQQ